MNQIMSASILLSFSLLSCFLLQVALAAGGNHGHEAVHVELIHRHAPEFARKPGSTLGPPASMAERVHELVHSDKARLRSIHQRLMGGQPRRKAVEATKDGGGEIIRTSTDTNPTSATTITPDLMELPVRSAADAGIGQYFVSARVGKPSEKFIMVADTGSTVTWLKCRLPGSCPNDLCPPYPRFLYPHKSQSFTPIPCSGEMCQSNLNERFFGTGECPNTSAPCCYDLTYADRSFVQGYFGNETLTIGLTGHRKIRMRDVIMGCGHHYEGVLPYEIDGTLGLGYDKLSFGVKAAEEHGQHTFSYCLVDHTSHANATNFLSFGRVSNPLPGMQYTRLLLGVIPPFYTVNVTGISVGGKMLNIPQIDMEIRDTIPYQGFIVDSGSSLTCLSQPIFVAVYEALASQTDLNFFKNMNGTLELCFDKSEYVESKIPTFSIHFGDGAVLSPPVKSYVIDERPGVKCFTFVNPENAGISQAIDYKMPRSEHEHPNFQPMPDLNISVIGNIMQQNYLWEFDLQNQRLGFAPSSCSLPTTTTPPPMSA